MKQIDLYLIEKLKINKYTSSYISSDKYGVDWVIADIPVCDDPVCCQYAYGGGPGVSGWMGLLLCH